VSAERPHQTDEHESVAANESSHAARLVQTWSFQYLPDLHGAEHLGDAPCGPRWHGAMGQWSNCGRVVVARRRGVVAVAPRLPWTNSGSPYESLEVFVQDDLCVILGLIKLNQGTGWNNNFMDLPSQCKPSYPNMLFGRSTQGFGEFFLDANGLLYLRTGPGSDYPVSLSGINFFRSQDNTGVIQNQVSLVGWRTPMFKRMGALCSLTGSYATGGRSFGQVLGTLPDNCRPKARHLFYVAWQARVDVTPAGEIIWVQGTGNQGIVSLDGIVFVAA